MPRHDQQLPSSKWRCEVTEIQLPDLPPMHDSHAWGPYGYFGEARCTQCDIWTDDIARGEPCGSYPKGSKA